MPTLILLPAATGAMLWCLFRTHGECSRAAALSAALVLGLLVTAVGEGLSALRVLTPAAVTVAWSLAAVAAGLALLRRQPSGLPTVKPAWPTDSRLAALRVLLAVLVVGVAVTGVWTPPNSPDVHTYRLARVLHWLQNQSLEPYPTACLRQLYQGPWAELTVLQIRALTGSDHLAFLPQFLAWLGAAVAASRIAERLAGGATAPWLAAGFVLTLPMAVLQASGASNDLVAGFWLLVLAERTTAAASGQAVGLRPWAEMGAALGLAAATKATAGLLGLPIAAWAATLAVRQFGWSVWRPALLGAVLLAAVHGGHSLRCCRLFGSPFGPGRHADFDFFNARMGPSVMAANAVRNVSVHLGTPFDKVNRTLLRVCRALQRAVGEDPNEPDTLWMGMQFVITGFTTTEDTAGNPLHMTMLLLVAVPGLAGLASADAARRRTAVLLSAAIAAWLLLSLTVRWQYYIGRLQLPVFLLAAAPAAVTATRLLGPRWAARLALLPALSAFYWLLAADGKPWFGAGSIFVEDRRYLSLPARRTLAEDDIRVAEFLTGRRVRHVGLLSDGHGHEYFLWERLRESPHPPERVEHVLVPNVSASATGAVGYAEFVPGALVAHGRADGADELATPWGRYRLALLTGSSRVYLRCESR